MFVRVSVDVYSEQRAEKRCPISGTAVSAVSATSRRPPPLVDPDQWGLFGLALKTLTAVIRKHISVDQLGGKRFS